MKFENTMEKVGDAEWEIPSTYKKGMNVPARIFVTPKLLNDMDDGVIEQITNVATLPGIQKYAYCMPDAHWGYGFPIGGVAAFDPDEGIISPGGVGFDINCGMRLLTSNLKFEEVKPKLKELVDELFQKVPAGVGRKGTVGINASGFNEVMENGVKWCVENGYAWEEDLERIEEDGCFNWADASKVSEKAVSRGLKQLGTLGSGNHYLEIQVAHKENIYDQETAKVMGINEAEQVVIMIHCGSRGLGHQVGTDYLRIFDDAMRKYKIKVLDRELACAPFKSEEGQNYYKAMACAANTAFVNRQVITHRVREAFSKIFGKSSEDLGMHLVYDVAHNIAKLEEHEVDSKKKQVVLHRKGSTRAFGPGEKGIPEIYRKVGQPVILGGSMETGSYLLAGTKGAMENTFGSTAHGSGRTMSRTKAKKSFRGAELQKQMQERGIYVKAVSMSGLAEEAGSAYKNISDVVEALEIAGISKKVVGLRPVGNVKG